MDDESRKTKVEYLKEKEIPALVDEMLLQMTDRQAEDPVGWIEEWARRKKGVVAVGRKVSLSLVPGGEFGQGMKTGTSCLKLVSKVELQDNTEPTDAAALNKKKVSVAHAVLDQPEPTVDQAEKHHRREYFTSITSPAPTEQNTNMTCTHLGTIPVALSYLTGVPHTLEDLFFTLKLPLHYLNKYSSMTLCELADIAKRYVEMKQLKVSVTRWSFDIKLYDEEVTIDSTTELCSGPRGPVVALPELAGILVKESNSSKRVSVVNFDGPTAARVSHRDDEETEGDDLDFFSARKSKFCVVSEFNPVKHEVTLHEPAFPPTGRPTTSPSTALLQHLYEAMVVADPHVHRARGFVEFRAEPNIGSDTTSSTVYHPRLLTGSGTSGTRLMYVHSHISTHLAAVAFGLHILGGQDEAGLGQVGVDVGGLVRALRLPLSMACDSDLPLHHVHEYVEKYLEVSGLEDGVHLGVEAVYRGMALKNEWDTAAAPPISMMAVEEDFVEYLNVNTDPSQPNAVLIICYNVNIAHDCLMLDRGMPSATHYGVVIGYDKESSNVTVADVTPKKFGVTWDVNFFRLYSSLVGRGYMIFKKSKSRPNSAGSSGKVSSTPSFIEASHLMSHPQEFLPSYQFPTRVFSLTPLSLGLCRLGYFTVPAEMATHSDFDLSFCLSGKLSIHDAQRVATRYIANVLPNENLTVQTYPLDLVENERYVDFWDDALREIWAEDVGKRSVTLFYYNSAVIGPSKEEWGGNVGVLTGYDPDRRTVTLLDSNPNAFYRNWKITTDALLKSILEPDPESRRPRSFLRLTLGTTPTSSTPLSRIRVKVNHPFKEPPAPHLSCLAFALSILGCPTSAENLLYAGRQVELSRIKSTMTVSQMVELGVRYLEGKGLASGYAMSPLALPSFEGFTSLVTENVAVVDEAVLCFVYDPAIAHPGVKGRVGLAIPHSASSTEVSVTDVNPTRYGQAWTRPVKQMYDAIQPDCSDPSYGIIRVMKKK